MSDFASLRAARQPKQTKSFVTVNKPPVELATAESFHPTLPAIMEMKVSPEKGRAIHATSPIRTGQTIVSLRPRVHVLSASYVDLFCSSCCAPFDASREPKRCSKCRFLWYCNSECQLEDWAIHKAECECLQHVASVSSNRSNPSIPPDAVRCLGRILFLKRKHGQITKEIESMHSLRSSLPTSVHTSHVQLAHALVQYLGASSPQELEPFGIRSSGELVDLISKFATNTHSLTTSNLTPIGLAVSPLLALVNHSCNPNAVLVFPSLSKPKDEPAMHLVCLQEIKPGDEITISYIDTTYPCDRRRHLLSDTYGFSCACSLCSSSDRGELDPRSAIYCPKRCGALCAIPTEDRPSIKCDECKAQARISSDVESVIDLVRIGQEGLDKATLLQDTEPEKALKLTTNLVPLLISAGLTNACHPLLALLRLQHLLLTTSLSNLPTDNENHQKVLDDAIRTAAKVLSGLCELLPVGHPVRGIHLAETGKLLAVDESGMKPDPQNSFPPTGPPRVQLAFNNLVEAMKELTIGFGTGNNGGRVGEEVRKTIVSLETEIGIWKDGVRTAWKEQVVENRAVQRSGQKIPPR